VAGGGFAPAAESPDRAPRAIAGLVSRNRAFARRAPPRREDRA